MAYNRFLIAPLDTGLTKSMAPFMIPDDAFADLRNAYVFRGRLQKRFGSQLINKAKPYSNRLRVQVATTDGAGDRALTLAAASGYIHKIGQTFTIGDYIYTVTQAVGDLLLSDPGAATVATFNTTTGEFVFTGTPPLTPIFFYPSEPVMGLLLQEISADINEEQTIAFDTRFAYRFLAGGWTRLSTETGVGDSVWSGGNSDFYWGINYKGSEALGIVDTLFVTNNRAADGIRYLQGNTWTKADIDMNYEDSAAVVRSGKILTARCTEIFEQRLLFFSVVQLDHDAATRRYPQRVWWCRIGSPLATGAFAAAAKDGAGFLDAPTQQKIITVKKIQNRLIVYFERSTWELVPTRQKDNAFIWRQINSEIGIESTHSAVASDTAVLGIADTGIVASTGANIQRIDSKIPDEAANFRNMDEGFERVYGIRDFYTEFIYWTFPRIDAPMVYPDRVLLYNYTNGSWAYNDDSITCFGYFWNQGVYETWESTEMTWGSSGLSWVDGQLQKNFRNVAAGNQQGYVFLIRASEARNCPALTITNITETAGWLEVYCRDHNLVTSDYVLLENIIGPTELNEQVRSVYVLTEHTFAIELQALTAPYAGGGTVARVSEIEIQTKDYNFFLAQGKNAAIDKIDFLIDSTSAKLSYDCYINSSRNVIKTIEIDTYPYANTAAFAERSWATTYPAVEGDSVGLRIYQTPEQLLNVANVTGPLVINAIMFYAKPTRAYF